MNSTSDTTFRGIMSFPDQMQPWEPTAYTANEEECTFENGKFYQAVSRSKRWEAKSMASAIGVKCLDRVDGRRKRWNITGLGQECLKAIMFGYSGLMTR